MCSTSQGHQQLAVCQDCIYTKPQGYIEGRTTRHQPSKVHLEACCCAAAFLDASIIAGDESVPYIVPFPFESTSAIWKSKIPSSPG